MGDIAAGHRRSRAASAPRCIISKRCKLEHSTGLLCAIKGGSPAVWNPVLVRGMTLVAVYQLTRGR